MVHFERAGLTLLIESEIHPALQLSRGISKQTEECNLKFQDA